MNSHLASGLPVVVTHPGGDGILVIPAHNSSTATMAFMIRHTAGFVQIALPQKRCVEMRLPPMEPFDCDSTRMCVGVDATHGVGTGISAADRATTARRLLEPAAEPEEFTRPGHLVPICVDDRGIETAASSAAIALKLVRSAGLPEGAVFAELVSVISPIRMMNHHECIGFARHHGLPHVLY
ncbi:3,4-dihydroxy-2-butanone-4-phosphate synthase [Rhodococcus qingshengii]|uniref:3,4-dihydroxy-2-butanone-4-phosphate synthase n=1 Tax=Rhodococcus qingshengii TaxID=334542 RepID=UPI0027AA00DA|nr:3,4-dihydroxy-2-butanone-4-phosphate synthase [Rhodococcus qingshengii]